MGGSERRRDERVEVRTDEREREREEKDFGRWKENRRRRSSVDDDEFVPPNASFFYLASCSFFVRFDAPARVSQSRESTQGIGGDESDLKHRKMKYAIGTRYATSNGHSIDRSLGGFFLSFLLFPKPRPPHLETKKQKSSFLGFEDLDVVDPTAGAASRAGGGEGGSGSKGGAGAGNVDEATRMAAFANFRDFIGMDITSLVTLPVWIMEPYTLLQKVAEIMEYTGALERAAETEDEFER